MLLPTIAKIFFRFFILLALAVNFSNFAHAQETNDKTMWQKVKNDLSSIIKDGDNALFLSGYAYHINYTKDKLKQLNSNAWGAGYGRILRNPKGNDETLFLLGFDDSYNKAQIMAGYMYEWVWPIAKSPLEAGLGISAMLISRGDMINGIPFPGVLPFASLGVKKAKLMFSYVPNISSRQNRGNVLFIFARFEF